MKPEEWRPVLSYEGLYEVSDQGRVRSLDRAVPNPRFGLQNRKGHVKRQCTIKDGYLGVSLCKNGKEVQRKVHILVAEAFLGPRPEWSTMVNHKDKVVTNNHVDNLEWSNNSHNKRHGNARYLRNGSLLSCSDLADIAGISQSTMYRRLNVYGWTVQRAVSTPLRATK
jgi:NUMOD4 motif/HNH endonuclease